jgi:hypothetical protein
MRQPHRVRTRGPEEGRLRQVRRQQHHPQQQDDGVEVHRVARRILAVVEDLGGGDDAEHHHEHRAQQRAARPIELDEGQARPSDEHIRQQEDGEGHEARTVSQVLLLRCTSHALP